MILGLTNHGGPRQYVGLIATHEQAWRNVTVKLHIFVFLSFVFLPLAIVTGLTKLGGPRRHGGLIATHERAWHRNIQ